MKKITKEEFLKMLKKHDWYYMQSDDTASYNAGKAQRMNIENAKKNQPELQDIYLDFVVERDKK